MCVCVRANQQTSNLLHSFLSSLLQLLRGGIDGLVEDVEDLLPLVGEVVAGRQCCQPTHLQGDEGGDGSVARKLGERRVITVTQGKQLQGWGWISGLKVRNHLQKAKRQVMSNFDWSIRRSFGIGRQHQ